MRRLAVSLLAAVSTAAALPAATGAQEPAPTLWGLPSNGQSLVQVRADSPSVVRDSVVITGLHSGEEIKAIDFRPRTGQLYGIGVEGLDTLRTYTIDTSSGVATEISSAPVDVDGSSSFGIGFNPVVDRIRVVNGADENMRINPNNGARSDAPLNDTNLNPANQIVTGIGYDRSFDAGSGGSTTLYGIASGPDTLVTIGGLNATPSPNGGTVNPIGAGFGLPATGDVGLDIGLDGVGYAAMTLSGVNVFFRMNLATGSATPINTIADGNLQVESLAVVPPSVVATATGTKGAGAVQVSDASTHDQLFEVTPFGGKKTQGIRVALGDLDLDSRAELIAAPGPKGKPKILTFDDNGAPLATIDAYDSSFRGGVFVASGDINADGHKDVIAAAGKGKTDESQIKVFDGETNTLATEFDAFARPFKQGVTVASADFDLDGDHEIVAGEGGGAGVRVFDGAGAPFTAASLPSFDNDFEAFPAGSKGGISVAAGDVNGDGTPDIVAGAGPGEAPEVAVFNGRDGAPLGTFAAFKSKFTGGVNVAVADVDLDGRYDIVASLGGEGDDVRAFDGKTFQQKDAWEGPKPKRGVAVAGVRR